MVKLNYHLMTGIADTESMSSVIQFLIQKLMMKMLQTAPKTYWVIYKHILICISYRFSTKGG